MPIYEYRCNDCGHQFEVSQRMSEDSLTECEVCGGRVQRVLFAPAIHFKGTGFHNTDYSSRRRPGGGDDGGSGDSGDSGSNGGSSEKAKTSESAAPASSSGKTVGLDKV